MEVIATKKGFYNKLREEGEKFDIDKKEDLGSWMSEVKQEAKAVNKNK